MRCQWKAFLGFFQQGSAAAGGSVAVHSHHAALWEYWKPGWGPNPQNDSVLWKVFGSTFLA